MAWNPWQSEDMYSHLRFEVGGDIGEYWLDRSVAAEGLDSGVLYGGVTGAVKSRFSLGEGGLHYLFTEFEYRRPTLLAGDLTGKSVNRLGAEVAYEGIFLAMVAHPAPPARPRRGPRSDAVLVRYQPSP